MYKALLLGLLATVPSSTNFTLKTYDFGTGADAPSSSSYNLQASTGSPAGNASSSTYALPAGIRASASLSAPAAPTFTNPDNSYNRLRVTLNTGGFASDVKYLIAISDDDFVTTQYVQTDQTIGPGVSISNYQTYAAWGGASGFLVLGLEYNTTYKVKVAALQGAATGSPFGPTATAATVAPSVTFAVSTSQTSTPPFAVLFTSLPPGSVTSANATVIVDITTNALHGGALLVRDQNAGLASAIAAHSISSATADLTVANSGYGAQVTNASQGGGGPISATSPFNGAGDNIGALSASWQELATFANAITGGSVTLGLKAKANASIPASTDYADTLTISATLLF